jgi:hypothetical protein
MKKKKQYNNEGSNILHFQVKIEEAERAYFHKFDFYLLSHLNKMHTDKYKEKARRKNARI